jgi:ABC-type Fe3+-hydroxamate transport system substrate-binding protein
MLRHIAVLILVLGVAVGTASAQESGSSTKMAATSTTSQATAGKLEKVSQDGKTITVKAADGTEHVFKVTGKTVVTGTESGAKGAALAGKEGSQVVVKYSGEGADKTAHAVDVTGKETMKATEGTVTAVGKGGHTVTMKLADGTEKTFDVGKEAMVDTGHGVSEGSKFTAKEGEKVVVYSTVSPPGKWSTCSRNCDAAPRAPF